MTAPLTIEQRLARIEELLGIGAASSLAPVPWALRRSAVMTEAARLWGVTAEELTSESRVRSLVLPRAAIVMALRCDPAMSYPQIGRSLGRDHSSIINLERIAHVEFMRDLQFAARTHVLMGLAKKPEALAS